MTVMTTASQWFISAVELEQCYQQQNVVVIDCRFSLADTDEGEALYQQGHIPGAHYFHLDQHMSGEKSAHGGRHPLPDVALLQQSLRDVGVNSDTLVVAYDANRFAFASRLWWLLRYIGHDQVKVLDGGLGAWTAAGFKVCDQLPTLSKDHVGDIVADPQAQRLVDMTTVKQVHQNACTTLVDSREELRYQGLEEPIDPVAGHIKGALNYPWAAVTDQEGFFTGLVPQQQRWQTVRDDQLVVYCGSGVTACVNLLALAEIGRDDAKLYSGSWSDWCSYSENVCD
ncbi:MAG: thiosulfate/3-mercaptopyruvate sulfurtransferase [Oceanicoccus sp.]|jgi:thiosulfate/3-mercaptopyruvate sulfurtransferase